LKILIKNAYRLYTFDDSHKSYESGYVYIDDNVIKEVGSGRNDHLLADEIIDASGKIVLPGLINVHHHFYQNVTRNIPIVQKCSLLEWLLYLYGVWAGIDEETTYDSARLAIAELLLTGCTTSMDFMYLYPNGKKNLLNFEFQAARELGLRFHGFRGCLSVMEGDIPQQLKKRINVDPTHLVESEDQIIQSCEEAFQLYHDSKNYSMSRVGVGPTTVVYDSPEFMKELKNLSARWGGLNHTHLHPRPDEVEKCKNKYNCTPLEFMEDIGWLDSSTFIAHATRHTLNDIKILARNGAGVTHSPSCHMRLGYPVVSVPEMKSAGVVVGIGVDGGASNDSGNMLGELRTTMMVHRIEGVHKDYPTEKWLEPKDVFMMAMRNGARLLKRNDIGSLEVGKAADLIIIDLNQIGYGGGLHDPLGALVYCGCKHIVDTSIINGEFVVRDGRLTKASEEDIVVRANKAAYRLIKEAQVKTGIDYLSAKTLR